MPKIIVPKEQITRNPQVALIKAFRIANKRAGEYARAGENMAYVVKLQHMGSLVNQAEQEYGFHIWVNPNGVTGHDYTHDYKETRDSDNDYDAHLLILNRVDGEGANDSTFGFPQEASASQITSKFNMPSNDDDGMTDWEREHPEDNEDMD